MRVDPPKSAALHTLWLNLPTGYALAWTDGLPCNVLMKLWAVTDDMEFAREEGITLEQVLQIIQSPEGGEHRSFRTP